MKEQYKFDLYEALGVDIDATQSEIKLKYIKLAKKLHPDRNQHLIHKKRKSLEERLCQINEAYSILSNSTKRRQYDLSIGLDESVDNYDLRDLEEDMAYKRELAKDESRPMSFKIIQLAIQGTFLAGLLYYADCISKSCQGTTNQSEVTVQSGYQDGNSAQLDNKIYNGGKRK